MRRARPMPGCGMSPSPAISLEVSTMTTRLSSSSASTRAASRSIVVLPMPGRPMIRTLFPDSTRSLMISIVPKTARPMRQVRPTILPLRLRIAEMRCSVRSMPARLSSPNEPMWSMTYWMSSSATSRSSSTSSPPPPKRASGRRPRSMTTSITSRSGGNRAHALGDLRWQRYQQRLQVTGRSSVVAAVMSSCCHCSQESVSAERRGLALVWLRASNAPSSATKHWHESAKPCSSKRRSSGDS